jgi:glycosyltransferase involved in cell wall biosynthesis
MTSTPLVTCVMPTCNRRPFVPLAIECFLRQDYPNLELFVVDDGPDPVADLMPADPRVRYLRQDMRLSIGVKRNFMCNLAGGEIIVHWDDDDWSAGWRVSYQVDALEVNGAELCGLSRVRFYEIGAARGWEYRYPDGGRPWVYGATLCYRKAFWRENPFPEIHVGEDTRFVWNDRARRLLPLDDLRFYLGTMHGANTSPKRTNDMRWTQHPIREIEAMLGGEWPRYRRVVEGH